MKKKCIASSIAYVYIYCDCIYNLIAYIMRIAPVLFLCAPLSKLFSHTLLRADLRPVNGRAKVSFLSTCAQIF